MSGAKKDAKKKVDENVESIVDINVLFNEETTDEAKEQIRTVFEAAVSAKANELLEAEVAARDEIIAEAVEEAVAELEEAIDEYLAYVVENWMEENKLAIESSFKVEMAESLMDSLQQVFVEHNMEIPEDADDVLEGLVARNDELQARLNEAHRKNMELESAIEESLIEGVVDEMTDGLTDTQVAKLKNLAEGIRYSDVDDFAKKLKTVKESFFNKKEKAEDALEEKIVTEEVPAPTVKPEQKKAGNSFADRINSAF